MSETIKVYADRKDDESGMTEEEKKDMLDKVTRIINNDSDQR